MSLNPRLAFLVSRITLLFGISFLFLWLHILDDAIITNEPAWYGISIAEFLLYCAFVYAVVPPLGVWLARRGSALGLVIVLLYAFQALYGGGINHIRHIFGDFRGSQFLPVVLNAVGVQVGDIRGHGFATVLMGMAGLGITPPHEHILASTIVTFINIALNAALLLFCGWALYLWFQAQRAALNSAQSERAKHIIAG
ncbi:MAG: hypothetical protein HY741_02470 [Chloroflexi bacterium]|nr:hypothetical protein [Chloroflexota bacterium]